MIKCPSCGAGLKYSIPDKQMKCDYCDNLWDPYIFDDLKKDAEGHKYETYVWLCPGCGAELTYHDDTDITSVCAYCGNANILFDRIEGQERPEKIIPFAVSKEECYKNYIKSARRSILTSSKYKKKTLADSFRGIYVPFWDYEVSFSNCTIESPLKNTHKNDSKYSYTFQNAHRAEISGSAKGIICDASVAMDDSLADNLAPFDKTLEKDFTPAYLSGFYADKSDETPDAHTDFVLNAAGTAVTEQLLISRNGKKIPEGNGHFGKNHEIGAKTKLYPVWFMSLKTKKGLTYSAINGADGKVIADLPVSYVRFVVCALIIAAAAYIVLSLIDFMPRPMTTAAISVALFAAAWLLNCNELRKIVRKDHFETYRISSYRVSFDQVVSRDENTDEERAKAIRNEKIQKAYDRKNMQPRFPAFSIAITILLIISVWIFSGFNSALAAIALLAATVAVMRLAKLPKKATQQITYLISSILFCVVIILADILVIMKPLNVYYYVFSGIIAACVLAQFVLLLQAHNRLAFREPPQFKKKGGDNNA